MLAKTQMKETKSRIIPMPFSWAHLNKFGGKCELKRPIGDALDRKGPVKVTKTLSPVIQKLPARAKNRFIWEIQV
ncbi:MAG: hypothetical protein EB015_16425, partial [Methylocystaceae bacterium]|nr:hypothetical protein [Methylocystaceae bacterium]